MAVTKTRILTGSDTAVQSHLNYSPFTLAGAGDIDVAVQDDFVAVISDITFSTTAAAGTLVVQFAGVTKWQIDLNTNSIWSHGFQGRLGGFNGEDLKITTTGTGTKVNAMVAVMYAGKKG